VSEHSEKERSSDANMGQKTPGGKEPGLSSPHQYFTPTVGTARSRQGAILISGLTTSQNNPLTHHLLSHEGNSIIHNKM